MDYGHTLRFGTFVTPSAAQPQAPVQLAQLSETLGYDLVTFQDHPYQASFLDTWTLMSFVASATERIHIAPNVLNLPLRPAPVTARAAASLDLLSGGRFDLGLGAGGFWDAIEAMGGRRLTPGRRWMPSSEAIDIMRGIWVGGRARRAAGAASTTRSTGRSAVRRRRTTFRSGWARTSRACCGSPVRRATDGCRACPTSSRAICNRATRASTTRRPRRGAIRRRSGDCSTSPAPRASTSSRAWRSKTASSTFIVMGDDPAVLQRFAEQVMEPVREAVASARATNGTVSTDGIRPARAIALRREGIAYDELPESLRETAVEPGDTAYASVRSTYMRGRCTRPRAAPARRRRGARTPSRSRDGTRRCRSASEAAATASAVAAPNDGGIVIDLKNSERDRGGRRGERARAHRPRRAVDGRGRRAAARTASRSRAATTAESAWADSRRPAAWAFSAASTG